MRNKPKGSRGSWFAEWENESIPVLWKRQFQYCDGEPRIITDWIGRERPNTGNKRAGLRKFYEAYLKSESPAKAILAVPKETNLDDEIVPEKKSYVGVFNVLVEKVNPEIELKVVERLWPS